ncbi:hypothetical protein U1Q18_037058 [Sarracenia purpurea var. burkii]
MWVRFKAGPLALTATPETVKSVRFCNRPSQTPVNLLRLLMQVKDWRFGARSEGEWRGLMGELDEFKVGEGGEGEEGGGGHFDVVGAVGEA